MQSGGLRADARHVSVLYAAILGDNTYVLRELVEARIDAGTASDAGRHAVRAAPGSSAESDPGVGAVNWGRTLL